jgi:hypothetical protein|tara:strand:- start:632 stop:937 length:306 start_codon:yes stop_codon:yes gene_type:complete
MIAYKLFKERKDGSIGPLFIGASQRIPIGEWLPAEDIPTKGFAHRPGWHTGVEPNAPHLKQDGNRAWYVVEIKDYTIFKRPSNQGGEWLIAQYMKVLRRVK